MVCLLVLLLNGCNGQVNFPASLMEMNKPEYLLKDSTFWNKNESQHFKFFTSKNVNYELINSVIENQEKNITHIGQIMGIKDLEILPKINVWIFNNDYEKYLKTQVRSNAHALTEYWSAYYNKGNASGGHEIGHIMSQHFWGYLQSKKFDFLLEEGFVFYIDENRFFKFDFYEKARGMLQNDKYRISTIIDENNNNDFENKAIVCGAFDKYLISNFGIEKFANVWKHIEDENIFISTYNKSLTDLEKDFYAFLESRN